MKNDANKRNQIKTFKRPMEPPASVCQTGPLLLIMPCFTELQNIKLSYHDTSMKLQNSNPFMSSQASLIQQTSSTTLNDFFI